VRSYGYGTSQPLLELDARLDGGERIPLLLKDHSRPHATKPGFVWSPTREGDVYRRILAPAAIGARLYAAEGARLLIEKVAAAELWQLDFGAWLRVAAWLRGAHAAMAPAASDPCLLRLDAAYYAAWAERAALPAQLAAAHATATDRLLGLPSTVIHNELYPANVLVGERVVPVDWELAAAGPAVVDLAALVTGWDEGHVQALATAYGGVEQRDVAAARLHLAVRWLGWARGWTPPREHARDWLAEAYAAAGELER
jgi:Phosphotransferase enzyme family